MLTICTVVIGRIAIMSTILLLLFSAVAQSEIVEDLSGQQLIMFKQRHEEMTGIMTTSSGMPIEYKKTWSSLNSNLLVNDYFMDAMTHFSRERIPERLVHAVGSGAMGYFEVTHNITNMCKAKVFSQIGKRTPVAVRFSLVAPNAGAADTTRDLRGFGIKFYTEDGNLDIVGLNTPVFALKDPIYFKGFTHSLKRNPVTHMPDANMLWDSITLRQESVHLFMHIFSDLGIPDGYRHMPGFGVHAFEVVNEFGEKHFVKFHFIPDAGTKYINSTKAQRIAGIDPDYANRDLYNGIASSKYPSWTIAIQAISLENMKQSKVDIFDVTRLWPESEYPLQELGKLVLNENPTNYFTDVEQIALNPGNLVPGINGAPDKLFEARRFLYRDTQYHRLGANRNNIPINCPIRGQVLDYNNDGSPPANNKDIPYYYPNSFNGPAPYSDDSETELTKIYQDDAPNNFDQVTDMYNNMGDDERDRLIENIVNSLGQAAQFLQDRAVEMFSSIYPELGARILSGLQANVTTSSWDDL